MCPLLSRFDRFNRRYWRLIITIRSLSFSCAERIPLPNSNPHRCGALHKVVWSISLQWSLSRMKSRMISTLTWSPLLLALRTNWRTNGSTPDSNAYEGRPRCGKLLKFSPSSPFLLNAAMITFTVDSLTARAKAVNLLAGILAKLPEVFLLVSKKCFTLTTIFRISGLNSTPWKDIFGLYILMIFQNNFDFQRAGYKPSPLSGNVFSKYFPIL